jgi:2-C-methyl-D-erythritol 4-phosphate cytidylyltransferase
MGREIYLSKGNQLNFKITTKEDLELFKGFVLMKKQKKLND